MKTFEIDDPHELLKDQTKTDAARPTESFVNAFLQRGKSTDLQVSPGRPNDERDQVDHYLNLVMPSDRDELHQGRAQTARLQCAAPGGNRAHAEKQSDQNNATVTRAHSARKAKTARTRYVRLFPGRLFYAIGLLKDDWKISAWLRFLAAYTAADGQLPANDKNLAAVTVTGKRWPQFRDTLLTLDLAQIEDGYWIDKDQDVNLEIQRTSSKRAKRASQARWGDSDV